MSGIDVAIIGVGLHPFGRHPGRTGRQLGVHAVRGALADAGLRWDQMQFAVGGSHDAGSADSLVADLGLTGLSFRNVANGCATGGSALTTAVEAIRSGAHEVGIVVGFDQHPPGSFAVEPEALGLGAWYGVAGLALTSQFFALKTARFLHEHDLPVDLLAHVASRAFGNGALNDHAWRRTPLEPAAVLAAPMVSDPLTKYMFCSPAEGAAALVVARADRVAELGALGASDGRRTVRVAGVSLTSREYGSFEVLAPALAPRRAPSPSVAAARRAFEDAGVAPADVDLAQVQDTDAGSELIHLVETGLCPVEDLADLVTSGGTGLGGRLPVNTDGGCLANGEPIGASGLRQIVESVRQLRGEAGARQMPGAPRVAFTHVYGAPGISSCAVLTV